MINKPNRPQKLILFLSAILLSLPQFAISGEETKNGKSLITTNSTEKEEAPVIRDPFWPVGYEPPKGEEPEEITLPPVETKPDWAAAEKALKINGVSSRSNQEAFAIINGKVRAVGDNIAIRIGNRIYAWEIEAIAPPKTVKLRRISTKQVNLNNVE